MHRRDVMRGAASLPLLAAFVSSGAAADQPAPAPAQGTPFDDNTVPALARQLAAQPYKPPDSSLPKELQNLQYSQYQTIRFKPEQALWRGQGLNFTAEFFHRGFLYKDRVDIYQVTDGRSAPLAYNPDQFSWTKVKRPTGDLGYAGFRLHYPLNRLDYFDEVCTFLGASYFRAVARGQGYGLSARGLAIKTADRTGEEFPLFKSFWLLRPPPNTDSITVHALLDSPSCTGAFRFVIQPGQATIFDTDATIFPRVDITQAGLAPLTAMFFFGPNDQGDFNDWRAAVHDSDGLSLRTGDDQRIWRPLINPHKLQISDFSDVSPRGFGLMQRARAFSDYQDLEADYQKRPSLWVEPKGDWGPGIVELVEIPSKKEVNDNIVAFWRPHDKLKAKSTFKIGYRLHWCWTNPHPGPEARVRQTRNGLSFDRNSQQFVIDFAGAALDAWTSKTPPTLDAGTDKGKILHAVVERNPQVHGWRVSIQLDTQKQDVVEQHARLMDGEKPLTETWIARWTAP
ncbi:MAG TPA: glucan biosynthesis protein G [Acetobacteraceae bacterium]|nr:glucan biosynthesis protein G [Acetobacteraceae bacterium]